MISLLLPIGNFSFFVRSCIENIYSTCGDPGNLDLVILISENASDHVRKQIKIEKAKYRFRVVEVPISTNLHLILLDWCLQNTDLNDWIITQHADIIWKKENWLRLISESISKHSNAAAICCTNPQFTIYSINEIPTLPHTDSLGIFNARYLRQNNLKFIWGRVHAAKLSDRVLRAINEGEIKTHNAYNHPDLDLDLNDYGRAVTMDDFLDGARLIQLELAVNNSPQFVLDLVDFYDHIWQIFRVLENLEVRDDTLFVFNREGKNPAIRHLPWAAYVSSFLIDREELAASFLPWSVLDRIWPMKVDEIGSRFKTIQQHAGKNLIKYDFCNIKYVKVRNRKINLNKKYSPSTIELAVRSSKEFKYL